MRNPFQFWSKPPRTSSGMDSFIRGLLGEPYPHRKMVARSRSRSECLSKILADVALNARGETGVCDRVLSVGGSRGRPLGEKRRQQDGDRFLRRREKRISSPGVSADEGVFGEGDGKRGLVASMTRFRKYR